MYTRPRSSAKKVELSFTNWVLGGSLVSVSSTASELELERQRRRSAGKPRTIVEVDSDDNEIIVVKGGTQNKIKGKDTSSGDEKKDKPGKKGDAQSPKDKSNSGVKKDKEGDDNNNDGWTEEQDTQIKDMKAVDSSWREIAAAVGASKKDVQHRFKELSQAEKNGDEEQGLDFSGLFDESDSGGAMDEGGKGGGGKKGGKEKACGAKNCCHGRGCGEGHGKNQKGNKNNNSGQNNGNGKKSKNGGWNTASGGGSGWNEKNNNNNNNWNTNGNGNGGGEKMWYDDPEVTGVQPDDDNNNNNQNQNQNQNQNNGNGNQNGGEKRNGYGRLRSDDVWSREDLEVLEFLEAKYEENKWMHMQAGFYNWGGRMVDASMIEKKFRDDGAV